MNAANLKYKITAVLDGHGNQIPNLVTRNGIYFLQVTIRKKRLLNKSPFQDGKRKGDGRAKACAWKDQQIKALREETADVAARIRDESKVRTTYPSISRLIEAYQEAARKRRIEDGSPSERTVRDNATQLLNVIRQGTGIGSHTRVLQMNVSDLTKTLVEDYVEKRVLAAGDDQVAVKRARSTCGHTLRCARSLFASWALAAYEEAGLAFPPSLAQFKKAGPRGKCPKYRYGPHKHLHQVTLARAPELKKNRPGLYLAFLLCYHAALRASEAEEARWEWLEDAQTNGNTFPCIRIKTRPYWKGAKSDTEEERTPPLSDAVYQEFLELRPEGAKPTDPILPCEKPTQRHNLVGREFAQWLKSLGWETTKKAHELRKLTGSVWYTKCGLEQAAHWLGDTLQVTYDSYSDLTEQKAPPDLSKLF
jgi:integrase